jgi:hypothetical protein
VKPFLLHKGKLRVKKKEERRNVLLKVGESPFVISSSIFYFLPL